jgi:hypothetical protein
VTTPDDRRRRLRRSRRQESDAAKRYNGSVTSGSGNGWRHKGDMKTDDFLFEMKRTDNTKQITVKLADLTLIRNQGLVENKVGIMQIEIGDRRFDIVDDDDFRSWLADGE